MRRMLCVAAAALVLLLPAAGAPARSHVYARVKCVGLYCAIIPAPAPRRDGRRQSRQPGAAVARMTAPAVRIAALVRLLLGTDKDGEALAAAAALRRSLQSVGLDHHAFAAVVERGVAEPPQPARPVDADDWFALVRWAEKRGHLLNARDRDFIISMYWRVGDPSEKQRAWLNDIVRRLRQRGAR